MYIHVDDTFISFSVIYHNLKRQIPFYIHLKLHRTNQTKNKKDNKSTSIRIRENQTPLP